MVAKAEADEVVWATGTELLLLQALVGHKPAGINKHFQMAIVQERLAASVGQHLTSEAVWAKLRTMYDLVAVDDREEVIPFPLEEKEFTLPKREFQGIMTEKQREIKERSSSTTSKQSSKGSPAQETPDTKESKKQASSKEKETKETPKSSKSESQKGEKSSKSEEPKSGSKRHERHATRSTPSNTPAKRRKN